jgi:hypothetical protein
LTGWRPDAVSSAFIAGLLVGAVLATMVAVVLRAAGDGDDAAVGSAEEVATAPSVPPEPPLPPMETPSSALPEESETTSGDEGEVGEEGDDDQEVPTEAPTIADAPPAGEGPMPAVRRVTCPSPTVEVSDADSLAQALASANPGDTIELAETTYEGSFVTSQSGTADEPIFLCGPPGAVLDGGDPEEGYTLHLDHAEHWRLVGFSVQGGQKGVMADGTTGSVIQDLSVSGTGDEAIHLRSHSTDNLVIGNRVSETGQRRDDFGEGIYIGSAVSNWCTYTDCQADRSDRNVVAENVITATTSEPIDIKEGTTGGALLNNVIDGSAMTAADTWVNLKGNNYLVQGNRGTSATDNGFETHDILPGWGDFNVFAGNSGTVGGSGWGIASWPEGDNVVRCDNDLADAAEGLSNVPCT